MYVRCLINTVSDLDDPATRKRLQRSIHLEGPIADLDVGKTYDVVALEERDGGIWLFLDTVEGSDHPYPYPIEMFDLLDSSLPSGWHISFEDYQSRLIVKRISFPEWVSDDNFYERLVDGDEQAVAVYREQRCELTKTK